MNLILLEPHEVDAEGRAWLSDHRALHIREILRATQGKTLRIGLLDGPRGEAIVRQDDGDAIELRCTFETATPPRPRIDLLLALPRPKALVRLWPQLAALGVHRIVLTNAHRVERFYFDSRAVDPACYRPLLIEGLQQACDTRLPHVTIVKQFKIMVEDDLDALFPEGSRIVLDPGADTRLCDLHTKKDQHVVLAIGPEGGWRDFEVELLESKGFSPAGLGTRILRTDTACVAALSIVNQLVQRHH